MSISNYSDQLATLDAGDHLRGRRLYKSFKWKKEAAFSFEGGSAERESDCGCRIFLSCVFSLTYTHALSTSIPYAIPQHSLDQDLVHAVCVCACVRVCSSLHGFRHHHSSSPHIYVALLPLTLRAQYTHTDPSSICSLHDRHTYERGECISAEIPLALMPRRRPFARQASLLFLRRRPRFNLQEKICRLCPLSGEGRRYYLHFMRLKRMFLFRSVVEYLKCLFSFIDKWFYVEVCL